MDRQFPATCLRRMNFCNRTNTDMRIIIGLGWAFKMTNGKFKRLSVICIGLKINNECTHTHTNPFPLHNAVLCKTVTLLLFIALTIFAHAGFQRVWQQYIAVWNIYKCVSRCWNRRMRQAYTQQGGKLQAEWLNMNKSTVSTGPKIRSENMFKASPCAPSDLRTYFLKVKFTTQKLTFFQERVR